MKKLARASNLPFYDIFAPEKVPLLKISDDVIASDLWFGPQQSKILATRMVAFIFFSFFSFQKQTKKYWNIVHVKREQISILHVYLLGPEWFLCLFIAESMQKRAKLPKNLLINEFGLAMFFGDV